MDENEVLEKKRTKYESVLQATDCKPFYIESNKQENKKDILFEEF